MDKIILKDKQELEIKESSSTAAFTMYFADAKEYLQTLEKLTADNLSAYQLLNSSGNVTASPENKECLTQQVRTTWSEVGEIEGLEVTFNITDVDLMKKALGEILAGQEIQDEAIAELAAIIAGGDE